MKKFSSFITKALLLSFFAFTISASLVPAEALAQNNFYTSANPDDNILVNTMCNVMQIITGKAGKAFAAFAIISIGIGFFTGKVSWGLMIGVAAGIAAMFGAPTIVAAITGRQSYDCGSSR